ncbi:MAG: hypothetical protein JNK86_01595 [Alphaproteobacteria bacterium]|nr:hypothetical protein [Alphaproteobacteria bacterium]
MAKKILIAKRQEKISTADAWVGNRAAVIAKPVVPQIQDPDEKVSKIAIEAEAPKPEEKIIKRRLTIDIPDALHKKIKSTCAQRGVTMVEEIEKILNNYFIGEGL